MKMQKLKTQSIILLLSLYFTMLAILIAGAFTNGNAAQFLPHDKIMDGFTHVQKAPQMGRPMVYLPAKKMFKGHHHKKGKPHGEQQKFGRGHSANTVPANSPTPSPAPTSARPAPTAMPVGAGVPGPNFGGEAVITDASVDLRGRDSPIKDQIGPICTAYSGNAGIENLIGLTSPDFSEDYTFSLYGEYSVDSFANTVPGKKLAPFTEWPRGGKEKSQVALTNHSLLSITYLGDGETALAKAALRKGHPVDLGLEVPADMASCLASIRPNTKVTSGGHAVLIVGYKDDTSNPALGGGYWIIKNSWSTGCGDHGYQYLPYSYSDKSYMYMYDMSKAQ
jgi:hypothetical protein